MVVHIVFFKIADEAARQIAVEKLESMRGQIPGLLEVEAGVDFSREERAFDVALFTRFESKEALAAYQLNPIHGEVVKYIRSVASESKVVDYVK